MDHHTNWFSFLPWYDSLLKTLNERYTAAEFHASAKQTLGFWFFESFTYQTAHHIFAAILVIGTLLLLSLWARVRLSDLEKNIIPEPKLTVVTFFELILDVVMGMMEGIIGKDYKRYVPMIGTCALFILFSNLLGLVPGFVPPTDNLNTTGAAAAVIFVWFNFHGLRVQGIHHITHILNPIGTWWGWFLSPLMGAIEICSVVVRPIALALRLAANMMGDHTVLFLFSAIFPILLPLPFFFLGLLVCVIQTTVFCLLSTVYIALHTEDAGH